MQWHTGAVELSVVLIIIVILIHRTVDFVKIVQFVRIGVDIVWDSIPVALEILQYHISGLAVIYNEVVELNRLTDFVGLWESRCERKGKDML